MLTPGVSCRTLLLVAALAGAGGGNFAPLMSNINSFYPQRLKGRVLGLNTPAASKTTSELPSPRAVPRTASSIPSAFSLTTAGKLAKVPCPGPSRSPGALGGMPAACLATACDPSAGREPGRAGKSGPDAGRCSQCWR